MAQYKYIRGSAHSYEAVEFDIIKRGRYVTTCVVTVWPLLNGVLTFPCGNGDDVRLSAQQRVDILRLVREERAKSGLRCQGDLIDRLIWEAKREAGDTDDVQDSL